MQPGRNTIRLVSTITSGPNVDYLYVSEPPRAAPFGAVVFFERHFAAARRKLAARRKRRRVQLHRCLGGDECRAGADAQRHLDDSWLQGFPPPGGSGQEAGNSGLKLQRSYEIQILNTVAGQAPALDGAAAIYLQKAPDRNAIAGAGHWQTYDIDFTAARWNGNTKISNARVTVHWKRRAGSRRWGHPRVDRFSSMAESQRPGSIPQRLGGGRISPVLPEHSDRAMERVAGLRETYPASTVSRAGIPMGTPCPMSGNTPAAPFECLKRSTGGSPETALFESNLQKVS